MVTRNSRSFSCFPQLLLLVFAGWMIFNVVQAVQYVKADYSGLPLQDYWRVVSFLPQYKAFKLSCLWVQHNEHRIVFPEIVFAADMLLLRGRLYLPIAVSAFAYISIWLVLLVSAYSQKVFTSLARELALALAGVLMTWKGCSTVIAMPFQLQFTLQQLACAMSLLFLARLSATSKLRYLAALIGAAVVATYCGANGMLIWPVLQAGGLLLRTQARYTVAIMLSAMIFTGTYFIGYHFMPSSMGVNLHHPILVLGYLCSYMGMPFSSFGSTGYGECVGAINLLLAATCLTFAWQRKLLTTSLGIVLFGSYTFIVLSAILTSLGHTILADAAFLQAKQVRYLTMPLVAWALLTIAIVWLTDGVKVPTGPLIPMALAGLFCWGLYNASEWAEATRTNLSDAQIVASMLRNEVFDPVAATTIFSSAEFVRAESGHLRAEHKSIFARGNDKWIGQNISALYPQRTSIAGKITRVIPVSGGLEMIGWADTSAWLAGEHAVLFVDEKNQIAGFGRRPGAGFPPELDGWDLPQAQAFIGFVSLAKPVKSLSVYVQTFHGKLLRPLDGRIDVPAFTASEQDGTSAVPGITWQREAGWSAKGDTYSSQNSSGVQTGTIQTAPFASPGSHCLIVSVLNGRSIYGQSVEIHDSDTKEAIAILPLLEGPPTWKHWRVPVPETTRNVMLMADDEGHEESQWLALGAPRQCP